MAKNFKLNIKNTQIAEAINLTGLKGKLAKKKEDESPEKKVAAKSPTTHKGTKLEEEELPKEEAPRIRARSKSAFAEPQLETKETSDVVEPLEKKQELLPKETTLSPLGEELPRVKTSAELRQEIFGDQELSVPETPIIREIEVPVPKPTVSKIPETETQPIKTETVKLKE